MRDAVVLTKFTKQLEEAKMNFRIGVGLRVRECRNKSGFTQAELSDVTGIGRTSLVNIEKGSQHIMPLDLVMLCDALSVSSDYLLGIADQE